MALDPAKVADTRAWLSKAALDLRAAEHEGTAAPPLTGDMVFHAQQLVEKSLKAFLSWLPGQENRKIFSSSAWGKVK
jgi:HEPN domain-containing protein